MRKVVWTTEATSGLTKLPAKDARSMVAKVEAFAARPRGPHGKWWKAFSDTTGRIRQGDWRAAYLIDWDAETVTITDVDHRSRIYG